MRAQRAYGAADLAHNMIQKQLVCMFVTGLRVKKIPHDVFGTCPATLDAAITAAGAAACTQALSGAPGRGAS